MDQVKLRVQSADGKDRGSLFTDGIWDKNRWKGAPKPNLQEVMVCTHELESGEWFLIEYVLPRQIVGEAEKDGLFDPASTCCRRTPLQALHWFTQQAFGPPPALVERVRRFAAKWPLFRSSPSAKEMLATIVQRHFVAGDDPLFSGEAQQNDRALLRDLELVFGSGSSDEGDYHANMLIEDVGVEGFIAWTNRHLDLLSAAGFTVASRPHEVQAARKGLHDVIGVAGNTSNLLHMAGRTEGESKQLLEILKSLPVWVAPHDGPPHDQDVVQRNQQEERRAMVAKLRPRLEALLPTAMRAVFRLDGTNGPLDNLLGDEFLHEATVNQAVAQLQRLVSDAEQEDQVRDLIACGASNKARELAERFWGIEGMFMRLPGLTKEAREARLREEVKKTVLAELQQAATSGGPKPAKDYSSSIADMPPHRSTDSEDARMSHRLDDDVERAFHLLRHYKDFVCAADWSSKDADTERAIGQLEDVLRRWLPSALASGCSFLRGALDALGNRVAAHALLEGVSLNAERLACLEAVSRSAVPSGSGSNEIIASLKAAARRWQALQPRILSRANGDRYVAPSDIKSARLAGMYWSTGIEQCPSHTGASLALAVACKALAETIREHDSLIDIRPALRLARKLRETPDWTLLDETVVARVLGELIDLTGQVEELVDVFEIGNKFPSTQQVATNTRKADVELAPLPQPLAPISANRFVKCGEYWSISFHGASVSIRDTKGMGYLGQLLRSPGLPLHTWMLRHGEQPPDEVGNDDVLDVRTIQEVRGRVTELTSLLENEGDPELREKATADLERSREYLKSGTGPSGGKRKSRTIRGDVERTREAVAQAITTAIKKIAGAMPALHTHLEEALDGPSSLRPCYRPQIEEIWQVGM